MATFGSVLEDIFGLSKGGGPKRRKTLTKEQQAVGADVSEFLQKGLAEGAGELGVPLFSEDELMAMGLSREGLETAFGMLPDIYGAFGQALSGEPSTEISERATEEFFEKSIATPLKKSFAKDILPMIQRAYRGLTSRQPRAIAQAAEGLFETLAGEYARVKYADEIARRSLAESAAGRATQALGMAPPMMGLPLALSGTFGAMASGLQGRRLAEAERTLPERNPYVNPALSFLGIPMTQMVTEPERLTGMGTGMAFMGAWQSLFGGQAVQPEQARTPSSWGSTSSAPTTGAGRAAAGGFGFGL